MANLQDVQEQLQVSQAAGMAIEDLLINLGYYVYFMELPVPLWPFIAAGFLISDLIGWFSGGKPVTEDTTNVIWAYNMSAYWPLHALAANLAMALKNGAPISDSRPAIQAQFSTWKQGTIESIQRVAGYQGGENDPGYWQLQQMINLSWAYSKYGQDWVLKVVKGIDQFTIGLSQLYQQTHSTPPPPPPPPPPTETIGQCESPDPDTDEILDNCQATQAALAAILDKLGSPGSTTQSGGMDPCCQAIIAAIAKVTAQLTVIAQAAAFAENAPPAIDLAPVTAAIADLAKAIPNYAPALDACCTAVNSSLGSIAKSISDKPATDTTGIVKAIQGLTTVIDIKPEVVNYLVDKGYIDSNVAQVIQSADFGDWMMAHLATWIYTVRDALYAWLGFVTKPVSLVIPSFAGTVVEAISNGVGAALKLGAAPMYPEIKGLIDAVVDALSPTQTPTPGFTYVDQDLLLSKTLVPALILNGVMVLADYFGWELSEQLSEYASLATEFIGLREVRELKVGQMMRFGPMREAEMHAKMLYRQEIPGAGAAASMAARGIISQTAYESLAALGGLPRELVAATHMAAQTGISAFILIRLLETGLVTADDLKDELRFVGMRDISQHRLIAGAAYLATTTFRSKLESAAEAAHKAGLISDQELIDEVDSAEQNFDRDSLVLKAAQLQKLIVLAKDLEGEYVKLYTAGVITLPQLQSYLEGIGLQSDMVGAIAGKAEATVNATLHKHELASAAKAERQTAALERRTALTNYYTGITDAPALEAALLATGMTAAQALAWVDLAVLKKRGTLRWLYGMQMPAEQATILKQRVTALTDQYKRLQITSDDYLAALKALGIKEPWLNALYATASAMITPKTAAFPVTVSTS
jgi:hypothetical protein